MERLYTIPLEVGFAPTPGVNNIAPLSFYGLSFVRVTFDYGVDFYFALQQTQISLLQNVSLPNNVQPQIQASSLVGEIYRYQVTQPETLRHHEPSHRTRLDLATPLPHVPGSFR